VERGREREFGQACRLGPVVPQPVGTNEHDPASGRLEPCDVRLRRAYVGAEPAGDHMGLRGGHGLGLGQLALRDHFLGERVVPGQPLGLGVGGQPVGAAVAEPADRDRVRADDRGNVGGRRRLGRRTQDGHGLVGLADRRQGRLVRVVAAPYRGEQHPHRRLGPGQRRLVRARRGRHPVADDGDRHRAVRGFRRRQGHRVLVPRMAQAAVGDPGQQFEVELDVVTAGRHLAAARFAVALGADHAGRGRLIERAHRALSGVPGRAGAADGRGQLGPARLAEAVRGADRPATGGTGDSRVAIVHQAIIQVTGRHVSVRGRIALAMSASSIRPRG
jgi:hypothetical protein